MKKVVIGILIALVVLPLIAVIVFFTITNPSVKIEGWAEMDSNILTRYNDTYVILGDDGTVAMKSSLLGRTAVEFDDVPEHTVNAFIAAEDKRFYEHDGVDYMRMGGAMLENIKNFKLKEGASTITQQLAKNTHLTNTKTFSRKFQEIRVAKDIEAHYTKQEIMTMYLNALYFGNNVYGVSEASRYYFGKRTEELSISESASLAAIINNPSYFNPLDKPENTLKRRNTVLERMCELGLLSPEELGAAQNDEIITTSQRVFSQYGYYCLSEATKFGEVQCDSEKTVYSHYNSEMQSILEDVISENNCGELLSAVVVNVESGKVVAAAANVQTNITDLKRQPASTIKPILCYAPAIEDGSINPLTPILDEKTSWGSYTPSNYKNKYYGWQTAEVCLSMSLNIPAVKLLEINGIPRSKTFAHRVGINVSNDDNGLALALGGLSEGVTLKSLADAYAAFARGGKYLASSAVRTKLNPTPTKAMSEDTAYFINKMLLTCAKSGTARKLSALENIAAKTGTAGGASGNTDAYCIAYNPKYVVAVWAGAETGTMESNIAGSGLPALICSEIMKNPALKSGEFNKPKSIVTLEVNSAEYEKNHRIILAGESAKLKDKFPMQFSLRYVPKNSSIKYPTKKNNDTQANDIQNGSSQDNDNDSDGNYKIVDNF